MKKLTNSLKKIPLKRLSSSLCSGKKGLCSAVVKKISQAKQEAHWMLEYRLKALEYFKSKPLPCWGPNLNNLKIDKIMYYLKPFKKQETCWNCVPAPIKKTFDKLGIPQAEEKYLAGLGAQYESEMIYHNLKKKWTEKGVLFCSMDEALQKHPKILQKYFGTIIPFFDNKFSALNSALWSGGSFVYIPNNVHVDIPLHAHFRINSQRLGQFERTLIIAEEGSFVNYIEGCTAANYSYNSLHSAVVEIVVKKNARVRYTTIQNWSKNVHNLVTKRAHVYENATIEWIDGNLGSSLTMKYPCVILKEPGAKAEILSIAMACHDKQIQDAGAKAIHLAENTSSSIISKSISSNGGRSSYRGMVKIAKNAKNSKSFVQCDALILDNKSRSDTYPYIDVNQPEVDVGHEASVSKIQEEKLFYLMSRGLSKNEAQVLIVNGFIEPFVKTLPMEYAVEMNRLIEMEMEKSIG